MIRNQGTCGAKAIFKLQADHVWCLTGTPIVNKLADLKSLLVSLPAKSPVRHHADHKRLHQRIPSAYPEVESVMTGTLLRSPSILRT